MKRVLFVCLGNICRSPMAEFLMRDIVKKKGIDNLFIISSAGTSSEEEGNAVHYGTKNKLQSLGIKVSGKYARKMTREDYNNYDYIIVMDKSNINGVNNIISDSEHKVHRLLDFTSNPRDISDPWYTHDFDKTYDDIKEGLDAFLKYLGY